MYIFSGVIIPISVMYLSTVANTTADQFDKGSAELLPDEQKC